MSGHGEKLNRKQEQALAALLEKPTIKEAAEEAGIGEATLRRWLKLDDFKAAYQEARRESVGHAVTQLQRASGDAVRRLQDIMNDPGAKDTARVTAARTVLEMAFKAVELEDLQARVEDLERRLGNGGEKGGA